MKKKEKKKFGAAGMSSDKKAPKKKKSAKKIWRLAEQSSACRIRLEPGTPRHTKARSGDFSGYLPIQAYSPLLPYGTGGETGKRLNCRIFFSPPSTPHSAVRFPCCRPINYPVAYYGIGQVRRTYRLLSAFSPRQWNRSDLLPGLSHNGSFYPFLPSPAEKEKSSQRAGIQQQLDIGYRRWQTDSSISSRLVSMGCTRGCLTMADPASNTHGRRSLPVGCRFMGILRCVQSIAFGTLPRKAR
jgi:hypothetical protein